MKEKVESFGLNEEVRSVLDLSEGATINDALMSLMNNDDTGFNIGDLRDTIRNEINKNWVLANGSEIDYVKYPIACDRIDLDATSLLQKYYTSQWREVALPVAVHPDATLYEDGKYYTPAFYIGANGTATIYIGSRPYKSDMGTLSIILPTKSYTSVLPYSLSKINDRYVIIYSETAPTSDGRLGNTALRSASSKFIDSEYVMSTSSITLPLGIIRNSHNKILFLATTYSYSTDFAYTLDGKTWATIAITTKTGQASICAIEWINDKYLFLIRTSYYNTALSNGTNVTIYGTLTFNSVPTTIDLTVTPLQNTTSFTSNIVYGINFDCYCPYKNYMLFVVYNYSGSYYLYYASETNTKIISIFDESYAPIAFYEYKENLYIIAKKTYDNTLLKSYTVYKFDQNNAAISIIDSNVVLTTPVSMHKYKSFFTKGYILVFGNWYKITPHLPVITHANYRTFMKIS